MNERVIETTLYGTEDRSQSAEISYDGLLDQKNKSPKNPFKIKVLNISDKIQPSNTVYNGGIYMEEDDLVLVARSEPLSSEIACIRKYKFSGNEFVAITSNFVFNESQDPTPFFHPEFGVMYSLVKTYSSKKDPEKIINYRSVLCTQKDPLNSLNYFGPLGQKGLKVMYCKDGLLVTARKREEKVIGDKKTIISSTYVKPVKDIQYVTPKFIKDVFLEDGCRIKGFYKPGEWGNVTDCMLRLEDGNIAFMGHIAKFGNGYSEGYQDKSYSVIIGILNPQTLKVEQVQMLLCADDVYKSVMDSLPPKRTDLSDVVYPRSMGFSIKTKDDGKEVSLIACCGVGDRHTVAFETRWPFSVLPDLTDPSNIIFNYPASTINSLFV